MAKKRNFHRADRVGKQILESLSSLLVSEIRDPRAAATQITEVKVTRDVSIATVYYVSMDDEFYDPEMQQALEKAAGFLRRQLAHELQLRHMPQLKFEYDESIGTGRRMEELLSGLDIPEEGSDG